MKSLVTNFTVKKKEKIKTGIFIGLGLLFIFIGLFFIFSSFHMVIRVSM